MVKFFVAKFQAFHQIRHVPTLKKARRGFPVSEGKEQQEGYGDDGQTTTPLDGSVRISSRIKSGEKKHGISSRIKKVELEIFQGVLSRKLHKRLTSLGDATWSPKILEVTFSTSPLKGRSLTVKTSKGKGHENGKNLGFPTFLWDEAWIFEPTNRRSCRFSESDPEDVVKPDAGIFGENRGGHQKGHLANG